MTVVVAHRFGPEDVLTIEPTLIEQHDADLCQVEDGTHRLASGIGRGIVEHAVLYRSRSIDGSHMGQRNRIRHAHLFAEQQHRMREFQVLHRLIEMLAPVQEVGAMTAVVHQEMPRLIEYDHCDLVLLGPGTRSFELVGTAKEGIPMGLDHGVLRRVVERGEVVVLPEAPADDDLFPRGAVAVGKGSVIGAPLVFEGRVHGVIMVTSRAQYRFDDHARRLIEIVAGHLGLALDRARLYTELHRQAVTDELTQLYNRRYLLQCLQIEHERARETQQPLGVVVVDLDRFKQINDTYGHVAGDRALCQVARVLRSAVRNKDIVGRWGGEEFCVLLPEAPLAEVQRVAERLRERLAHDELAEAGVRQITASVGVAMLSSDDTVDDLFGRADHAAYAAKREGSNRVMTVLPGSA